MLKPITTEEKLKFTLEIEGERACQELLAELFYEEKYNGYVDIWPVFSTQKAAFRKAKLKLTIKSNKVLSAASSLSHPDASRFHVCQGKGVKLLKK
jgi:hypothetical protein